ncbi:MAG: PID-CTERM protein-sorting domain-containing protein [Chitinophagaceae bacterium]
MKTKLKIRVSHINTILLLLIILLPMIASAQPGFDDDVNDVPIDGGLSLLVAAGVGYGVKKMRDKRKSQI